MKAGIFYSILFFIPIIFSNQALAQEKSKLELDKCARLEGGFILGGQVFNDNLIYNPGASFQYSYCLKSGEKAGFGLGAGVLFFEEEAFIPFYADFVGLINKNQNTKFLTFQAGYAFGWSSRYKSFQDYSFKGGIYFSAGLGRKFRFSEKFSPYISIAYKHQFASLTYKASANEEYNEDLNFDMIVLSIGIMLEQK